MEEWAARIPAGEALTALEKVLVRGRGQATVELFLSGKRSRFLSIHTDPFVVVRMNSGVPSERIHQRNTGRRSFLGFRRGEPPSRRVREPVGPPPTPFPVAACDVLPP